MFVTAEQKVLQAVAMQLMNGDEVVLDDQKLRVKRVGRGRLRMVQFKFNGRMFEAIEQNRMKPSRWGQLAREKHQVVQFRDVATHKYVAVAVDGEIRSMGDEAYGCEASPQSHRDTEKRRTQKRFSRCLCDSVVSSLSDLSYAALWR